ncbi:MAG: hypothetical protein KDB00_29480 [Planctomycetales bacterium]|nr:hypothetical protein [Planctomycetales bacterium]
MSCEATSPESGAVRHHLWVPAGNQIGPDQLLRPIGNGGMGAVYPARHRDLGKQVAIKLLPVAASNHDQRLERFLREIRAAGSLNHSPIVFVPSS